MNVLDVADDNNYLYAATDTGIYAASLNSPNLADFNNWFSILVDSNNEGDFNHLIFFNGNIYANYAKPDATGTSTDELWKYENGTWTLFSHPELPASPKRYSMRVINNELVVTNEYSVSIYNTSWQRIAYYDNTLYENATMRDGINDNGTVWIADRNKGLIRIIQG